MRRKGLRTAVVALVAAGVLGFSGQALATPAPPTEGGNGAGKSGQCTGPQEDRPSSCKSQGGPGNQP